MAVTIGKDMEVAYTISATDVSGPAIESAIAGTKKVSGAVDTMEGKMKSQVAYIQKHWMGISAAIYAAYEIIKKAWNMAESAASYNEQMQMLNGLAAKYGTTATAITDKIREIGDGMISMATAAEVAMAGLAKGMSPDAMYQMAEAAVVLKDVMGTTADDAFKRLSEALTIGKEKTLKMAVGVIDLKDRYGEAADKMSDTEKAAKMLELVMERVRDIQTRTAGSTKSMADEMETLETTAKDASLMMGQLLLRGIAPLAAGYYSLKGSVLYVVGALYSLKAATASLLGDTVKEAAARATANAMYDSAGKAYAKSEALMKVMFASTEELQKATAKAAAAAENHGISIGKQEEALKAIKKAIDPLIQDITKWGEAQLKVASVEFDISLSKEAATILELKTGMDSYLETLQKVYTARIAGEKAIAEFLKGAGAKPEEVMKAQLEALKQEEKYYTDRQAGTKKYYDTIQSLHAKTVEAQKTKEKELAKIQNDIFLQRISHEQQVVGLLEKLMVSQGKVQTDESIFLAKRGALEREWGIALGMSGEAQVKALNAVKDKFAALTGEVTTQVSSIDMYTGKWVESTKTIITGEESIKRALETADTIQKQILLSLQATIKAKQDEIDKVNTWESELKTAMDMAQAEMTKYKALIDAASLAIQQMDREIAISAIDNASPVIQRIKNQLDQLQNKVITVTVNQVAGSKVSAASTTSAFPTPYVAPTAEDYGVGTQGWWNAVPEEQLDYSALGNAFNRGNVIPFARGDIFDRPTLFPMAKGMGVMGEAGPEAVIPLKRGSDGKLGIGGGQVINIAAGAIIVNGMNKTGAQIVNEIWNPLKDKMRKENAVLR
jgi:hypothetical protein